MKKPPSKTDIHKNGYTVLFQSISSLIDQSRQKIIARINSELTILNFNIGLLIKKDALQNKKAGYGEQIILLLSQQLSGIYGNGWSEKHLRHCLRAAETFNKKQIVSAVRRQLSWTHLKTIMYLNNKTKIDFYFEMSLHENWNTRQLQDRINSMLFERTAISKKPAFHIKRELSALRKKEKVSADLLFRDPYFFDFLGLKGIYSEKDLESSIIADLQNFISEIGNDFAFLARQKRIIIGNEDYYIDLLFYHRTLRRLVVIDLKLGKFKAADKAQMELYLNWLAKHESASGEDLPIGLILCADKSEEYIELLTLNNGNIRVAQYFTELPPKKLLERKLHKAIANAKAKFKMT